MTLLSKIRIRNHNYRAILEVMSHDFAHHGEFIIRLNATALRYDIHVLCYKHLLHDAMDFRAMPI